MNFNDDRPIYLQIASRICDEILAGVYVEGGRIPSVRDYAVEMEVNANTAAHSYTYLEQQGVIEARRGQGYFVTSDSKNIIRERRKSDFFSSVVPSFFANLDLLGIGFGEIEKLHDEYVAANVKNNTQNGRRDDTHE